MTKDVNADESSKPKFEKTFKKSSKYESNPGRMRETDETAKMLHSVHGYSDSSDFAHEISSSRKSEYHNYSKCQRISDKFPKRFRRIAMPSSDDDDDVELAETKKTGYNRINTSFENVDKKLIKLSDQYSESGEENKYKQQHNREHVRDSRYKKNRNSSKSKSKSKNEVKMNKYKIPKIKKISTGDPPARDVTFKRHDTNEMSNSYGMEIDAEIPITSATNQNNLIDAIKRKENQSKTREISKSTRVTNNLCDVVERKNTNETSDSIVVSSNMFDIIKRKRAEKSNRSVQNSISNGKSRSGDEIKKIVVCQSTCKRNSEDLKPQIQTVMDTRDVCGKKERISPELVSRLDSIFGADSDDGNVSQSTQIGKDRENISSTDTVKSMCSENKVESPSVQHSTYEDEDMNVTSTSSNHFGDSEINTISDARVCNYDLDVESKGRSYIERKEIRENFKEDNYEIQDSSFSKSDFGDSDSTIIHNQYSNDEEDSTNVDEEFRKDLIQKLSSDKDFRRGCRIRFSLMSFDEVPADILKYLNVHEEDEDFNSSNDNHHEKCINSNIDDSHAICPLYFRENCGDEGGDSDEDCVLSELQPFDYSKYPMNFHNENP